MCVDVAEGRWLIPVLCPLCRRIKSTGCAAVGSVTRLVELCDLAGKPIAELLPNVNDWCEKAKEERHNLAHHYGRTIHQASAELLYSSEVAYWLFVLCLLRLADAPGAVFDHVAANPDFRWLRERLR
jgi:hypothetical protein